MSTATRRFVAACAGAFAAAGVGVDFVLRTLLAMLAPAVTPGASPRDVERALALYSHLSVLVNLDPRAFALGVAALTATLAAIVASAFPARCGMHGAALVAALLLLGVHGMAALALTVFVRG